MKRSDFSPVRAKWPAAVALVFALSACLSGPSLQKDALRRPQSAYGNFLAARYASAAHDVRAAAAFYKAALRKDPGNSLLRQKAFLSALLAGDVPAAAGFAGPALGSDAETNLMRLTIAARDLGKKRFASADAVLSEGKFGPFNREAGQLLRGWAAMGEGDVDKALALTGGVGQTPVFARIARLNTALMLDMAGRDVDAGKVYADIFTDSDLISDRGTYAYGNYLQRHEQTAKARALYQKAIASFTSAPLCSAALKQLDSGKPAAAPLVRNAREGAAEALYGPAQILAARAHFDRALVYLEMARTINPRHEAATELLARLMEVENRPDDALAAFASIAPDSPYRLDAELNRARALFRLDRRDQALTIFSSLAAAHPGNAELVGAYADALRAMRQYDKALPLYQRLIEQAGDKAGWALYFSRGTVLERLGKWRQSIKDFRAALKINPDQPDVLNYLGYTYIDAGENLDEGLALIERAVSLRPDAGYIVDSLGWAHYRLGHYQKAVRYLERAVELEPGQATISDHLGDAYWQAGRHLEARFQWQHTLSLPPDEDIDLDAVRKKLANGLQSGAEIAKTGP